MTRRLEFPTLQKPDIMAIMEREGIEGLKRRGRDFWAPCPFHADKTPSFKVSPEKQRFHCFGCGEHGDSVDFIMKRHGVNFKDALAILGIRKGKPTLIDPVKEKQRQLIKAFERWRQTYYFELCDQLIDIHALRIKAEKRKPLPEALGFWLAEKLTQIPLIEYQLDILSGTDIEAKFELFKEASARV